jgi:hypothetical protein
VLCGLARIFSRCNLVLENRFQLDASFTVQISLNYTHANLRELNITHAIIDEPKKYRCRTIQTQHAWAQPVQIIVIREH